jgi:hypothetical protein
MYTSTGVYTKWMELGLGIPPNWLVPPPYQDVSTLVWVPCPQWQRCETTLHAQLIKKSTVLVFLKISGSAPRLHLFILLASCLLLYAKLTSEIIIDLPEASIVSSTSTS